MSRPAAPLAGFSPRGRERIVRRLLEIAGDRPRHIVMPRTGPNKYETVHRPVDLALVERHLAGEITIGSELRRVDGTTWSVCWDADNAGDWRILLGAAGRLAASGAHPLIERSPNRGKHAGGGHLWLVFPEPVDPGAVRATAEKHAPALAGFREFWPRAQSVRLPAGYYRREPYAAWCPLVRYAEGPEWRTGQGAAELLLSAETPRAWVSEPAPPDQGREVTPATSVAPLDRSPVESPADRSQPAAATDPHWLRRYGAAMDALPYWITHEQAIRWYNDTHDVRELLPKESNGYARAVWRGDDTPSIGYLDGNRWADYGGEGRRGDGRYGGGDAFEAYALIRHGIGGRHRALADVVRRMIAACDTEVEGAARAGRAVPGWVAEVLSPEGWRRYTDLRIAEGVVRGRGRGRPQGERWGRTDTERGDPPGTARARDEMDRGLDFDR